MNKISTPKIREEFSKKYEEIRDETVSRLEKINSISEDEKKKLFSIKKDDIQKVVHEGIGGSGKLGSKVYELIVKQFERPAYLVQNDSFNTEGTPSSSLVVDGIVNGAKERIERAIKSVGRINLENHEYDYAGTAWVVEKNVIVTNRHVATLFSGQLREQFVFIDNISAELDILKEHESNKKRIFNIEKVLWIAPLDMPYDVAFLSISEQGYDGHLVPQPLKIDLMKELPVVEEGVEFWSAVIGYPSLTKPEYASLEDQYRIFRRIFGVKRMQPGLITYISQDKSQVFHDGTTLSGNSGSTIINIQTGEAIALHWGGTQGNKNVNSGVAAPVVAELLERYVLNPLSKAKSPSSVQSSSDNRVLQEKLVTSGDGTATWKIPLEVSVTVGAPVMTSSTSSASSPSKAPEPVEEGLFFGSRSQVTLEELKRIFTLSSLAEKSFSWNTALSLAAASELAYKNKDIVRDITKNSWGLMDCKFIDVNNTQCFIASWEEKVLIAFRGTESLGDWLADLNFLSVQKSYGEVHEGFYDAFVDVKTRLEQEIKKISPKEIILTGHSLGGALAIIAAAEWSGIHPVSIVYTFGQPAVGKKDFFNFFTTHYTDKMFRFVNDDDIVTRVPPGYNHLKRLYHLNVQGKLESITEALSGGDESKMISKAEFDSLRAQLLIQRSHLSSPVVTESFQGPVLEGFFSSISDHSLSEYIRKIKQQIS